MKNKESWQMVLLSGLVIGFIVLLTKQSSQSGLVGGSIRRISEAIAFAEGFYITGSRAMRNHNPGNLTADLGFVSIGLDGPFVVFENDDSGWSALDVQVQKILNGTSGVYGQDWTIAQIAKKYTTTEQSTWANNVASALGVTPDTRLIDVAAV